MPGVLPEGEPVPRDGALPDSALSEVGKSGFGFYVHVPFCASRCGYCDFNTYTPSESGLAQDDYVAAAMREITLAKRVLGHDAPPVETVFFGGGTPTMLTADQLGWLLDAIDRSFGLTPDAEVTTEANPESVDLAYLRRLRDVGFTRVSLGMQSAAPGVLRILERRHTPGRATAAATEAREAGFEHVNLDLIYGTPTETPEDFAQSLRAAIDAGADHVSAYSLIVEDGTRLATQVRRGEIPQPSDDIAADRYLAAEQALTDAGFSWYEVSNWATSTSARCRHNLLYWQGGDWWGIGPGAHSHVGGVRWWNVKRPGAYADRLREDASPGHAREILTERDRYVEDVMLRLRLSDGMPLADLRDVDREVADAVADGLLDRAAYESGRAALTLHGRLLADAVIRDLL
jgi:putative oxygen-independent coproporphyrinogen III oxidase